MKKSLVALAALSATAAMAQVTLDGYMDRAYTNTSNTLSTKNAKTIGSQAGTTTFGIKVNENLSSDLSAGVWISTDWNDVGGATQDNNTYGALAQGSAATVTTGSVGTTTSAAAANYTSTLANPIGASTQGITNLGAFANSQNFFRLTSKSMGELRLGTPNNFTLTNATAVASPLFSTGIGSAYSSNFSIANGYGTGTLGGGGIIASSKPDATAGALSNAGARAIRNPNTIQFQSTNFNGFVVGFGKTLKNANADTVVGSTRESTVDTIGVTEYMVRYTNGPIDAMYTSIKYDSTGISNLNWGTKALGATNTQNLLAATYTVMPGLKLHAGFGNFSSSTDYWKGKSTQYGATYSAGQWDFMAQMAKVDDQSASTSTNTNATANMDRKMTGIGVNYNLSKTTRAYLRFDDINYYSNGSAVAGSAQKRTALGMSVSF